MYTRSYSSRRQMPPDYGGTALTFKPPHTEEEQINIQTNAENDILFPRKSLFYKSEKPEQNPIASPFGKRGQDEFSENSSRAEQTSAAMTSAKENSLPSLFDLENLKNDDLLLLGIAFMLLAEKNNDRSNIPTDALLILAMLYLSGL